MCVRSSVDHKMNAYIMKPVSLLLSYIQAQHDSFKQKLFGRLGRFAASDTDVTAEFGVLLPPVYRTCT